MPNQIINKVKIGTEPFVVMVKPVGSLCNLDCSYCYYLNTVTSTKAPTLMSDYMLDKLIHQYIEASQGPIVSFTWHGGEPTLAGLAFYQRVVQLQQQYLPFGWTCWNSLQTNGINLNEQWCSFLAQAHFDVGISIDGTQVIHDHFRKDHNDKTTYRQVVASIKRLKNHGILPDLLCTVTSLTTRDPLGVYRALRELDTGWIQFIPIIRKTPQGLITEDSVSAHAYGDFLCTVFDEWISHDLGRVDVQMFAETALIWAGGTANVCWMAPTCGRVLVVEHDGNVYSCDHFVNPQHCLGNFETTPLLTLVDSLAQRQFGEAKHTGLINKCRACPYLEVCQGGCPKDRFKSSTEPGLHYLCEGLSKFYKHAKQPLQELMRLRKQGLTPLDIMTQLRNCVFEEE